MADMDDKKKSRFKLPTGNPTHASIEMLVGAYIIYMAYQMLKNTRTGASNMSMTTTLILVGIMLVVGLAVIGYGGYIWYGVWKRSMNAMEAAEAAKTAGTAETQEEPDGPETPGETDRETERNDNTDGDAVREMDEL